VLLYLSGLWFYFSIVLLYLSGYKPDR
jgi:preprotein translocase subunit SecG